MFKVRDQAVKRSIDSRDERLQTFFDTAPADAVAVMVEVAPRSTDQNEGDTRLDQPSRQQSFLADAFPTVQIASFVSLLFQIEGLLHLSGNNHFVRFLRRSIKRVERALLVNVSP